MKTRVRCAINTRKSSEEGLDMAFNSLDAQREACHAYVLSQKHEGWQALTAVFDDGGYSGGNMERPGLKAIMAGVAKGQIDVIVVYKVDRLTRSLSDFAKIVDLLDKHGVSFVSITQQFNTTTSMGRLTLNVLLSFAQFEREITGERIRDKIAASRRKGLWTGGNVPLGYQRIDRKLVPHETEVSVVQQVFERYLEVGCVRKLQATLERDGVRGKERDGKAAVISRGALYLILRNPIYIGQIRYRDEIHTGEHTGIVDLNLWQRVQTKMSQQMGRIPGTQARKDSPLLAGLLYDADGERMTPSTTKKGKNRYRYYVSRPLFREKSQSKTHSARLPASEIEAAALTALVTFLRDPMALMAAYTQAELPVTPAQTSEIAARLSTTTADQALNQFAAVIRKVVWAPEGLGLTVDLHALFKRVYGEEIRETLPDGVKSALHPLQTSLVVRRKGQEVRIAVAGQPEIDSDRQPGLIRAIARGRDWWQRLLAGDSMETLCRHTGYTDRYIRRLLPLAFLSPRLVTQVVNGQYPADLTLERLLGSIKLDWRDQANALGIQA